MKKKGEGASVVRKKTSKSSSEKDREMQKILIENFVSLQKVLTQLSFKFDNLSMQVSELLKVFEESAKVIVKNELSEKKEDRSNKQLLDTMVSILDQNKIIAKGLSLMYEQITEPQERNSPVENSIEPEEIVPEVKPIARENLSSNPSNKQFPSNSMDAMQPSSLGDMRTGQSSFPIER